MPLRIEKRTPTPEDLARGEGVPSGIGSLWRVFYLEDISDLPFRVYLAQGSADIATVDDWLALPEVGIEAIVCEGGYWHGADEYVFEGISRFGLYLSEAEYERIEKKARGYLEREA